MTHRPMDADELEKRHRELQALKKRVEVEIVAIQDALRMHGRWGRAGRPRKAPTHTDAEALDAHNRYMRGETEDPWVVEGHRQYQRDSRRRTYGQADR